jgi:hypothetical protein
MLCQMTVANAELVNHSLLVLNDATDSDSRTLVVPNFCDIPDDVFYTHVMQRITTLYRRGWRTVPNDPNMPYFITLSSQPRSSNTGTHRNPWSQNAWDSSLYNSDWGGGNLSTSFDPPLLNVTAPTGALPFQRNSGTEDVTNVTSEDPYEAEPPDEEPTDSGYSRCPVCLQKWDQISALPVLMCLSGHCACRECVKQMVESELGDVEDDETPNVNLHCAVCRDSMFQTFRRNRNFAIEDCFVTLRLKY